MSEYPSIEALIAQWSMRPHPEGGYYAETYRANLTLPNHALPTAFAGDRSASTAIVFLLPIGTQSSLHRIAADEVWHFYGGDPLVVVSCTEVTDPPVFDRTVLGIDLSKGMTVQHVVKAGLWFGAVPLPGPVGYSFVGCTVAPGFDFEDFELWPKPLNLAPTA